MDTVLSYHLLPDWPHGNHQVTEGDFLTLTAQQYPCVSRYDDQQRDDHCWHVPHEDSATAWCCRCGLTRPRFHAEMVG